MRKNIVFYGLAALVTSAFPAKNADCSSVPCQSLPTCQSLGYTFSVADCKDRNILRCPRDITNDNAVFCSRCNKAFKYSKDDNVSIDSESCTDPDGEVYYNKICSGTKEGNCSSGLTFQPNCTDIHKVNWGSCACTYKYDTKNYPNVKSGSSSCKRNGVTYYSALCGGVSKNEANCSGGTVFTHQCYSYNGISYGVCGSGNTISVTAQTYAYTSNHDVMNIDTITYGYTLYTPSGEKVTSGSVVTSLNGSKTQNLASKLSTTSYKLSLGKPDPHPWNNTQFTPCSILAVTFNGVCYTNASTGSLFMPTMCKSSHQPLGTTITLPVRSNGTNNLQIVGLCTG